MDSSLASMAHLFYPTETKPTTSAPSQPAVPSTGQQESTEQTTANALYRHTDSKNNNESSEYSEEKTTAEAFYGESTIGENGTYARLFKPGMDLMADKYGLSEELLTSHREDTAKLMVELEVEPQLAEKVHDLYSRHMVNPADDKTRDSWAIESRKMLRETYGKEANAKMQIAKEYVEAKGLTQALEFSGLGNNPLVVKELVERASRLKLFGKFPGKK